MFRVHHSVRCYSTHFPYPTHRNPTPHQIFHLPHSATHADIKSRYYDLVRIYHPDKAKQDIPPELAQQRFQAITTAYDILRGKKPGLSTSTTTGSGAEDRRYQTTAAYRAARRKRQELYSGGAVDDRWKDRIFIAVAVATVGVFVLQTTKTRRDALAEMMHRPFQSPELRQNQQPNSTSSPTTAKVNEDEKRLSA